MPQRKPGDTEKITCIICPNSCRLEATMNSDGSITITGHTCPRGEEYGKNEFIAPVRSLITTMRINNGVLPVIPVRSNKPLPKEKIFEAMNVVNQTSVDAPVKMGQVIIQNILGLQGIDVIASRDMEKKGHDKKEK